MQAYAEKLQRPDIGFVVAAMFTPGFVQSAVRLKESLDKFDLNYSLYQVPSVHRSISAKGSSDLDYCKPNFVLHAMEKFRRPILYLDADVVMREAPTAILDCANGAVDFAIYNWLADIANDAYAPINATSNRFWKFALSIDFLDPSQLMCSGATQYYACSEPAKKLLMAWLDMIQRFPGTPDDELLSYAYNSRPSSDRVNTNWLDKGYCRYPWWMHVRPIIDHPDFPAPGNAPGAVSLYSVAGHEAFDSAVANKRSSVGVFPRELLIDTEERQLLDFSEGKFTRIRKFADELWLSRSFCKEALVEHSGIGRNTQCPCGSGKRYKHCHGRSA